MSLLVTWRASGAPCDSCGGALLNQTVTVTLTNAKAELGYKLPDLTLCAECREPLAVGLKPAGAALHAGALRQLATSVRRQGFVFPRDDVAAYLEDAANFLQPATL